LSSRPKPYVGFWSGNPTTYSADLNPVTVGLRFTVDVDGFAVGARYYRDNSDGSQHIAVLWHGTVTAPIESIAKFYGHTAGAQGAAGWESAYWWPRVPCVAGDHLTLHVWFQAGRYWWTPGALTAADVTVGHFTLQRDTATFFNGANGYGANMVPNTREAGAKHGIDLIYLPKVY
jgi:Domain of unknown function (DUF4082)